MKIVYVQCIPVLARLILLELKTTKLVENLRALAYLRPSIQLKVAFPLSQ